MRIAVLYDIHGNLPALEAVLKEVAAEGVDHLVVGGDVMPGPFPGPCLDALTRLDLPTDYIHGNGEREVSATLRGEPNRSLPESVQAVLQWTGEQLDHDHRSMIAALPGRTQLKVQGLGAVLFCHATPENDTDVFTRDTPQEVLKPLFQDLGVDLVFCGHTHMRFDRRVGHVRVVNPGSVGMPFDEPGAYWALLGPEVELRRTDYDLEAAADRIRESGYPGADAFAGENVLDPPSAAAMLRVFNERALS